MAILTINHNINLVTDFINDVSNGENSYYCFVSKATPWTDANGNIYDSNVPEANNSIFQVEQGTYQNIVYGKRLSNSDVVPMVVRNNWSNGTVYARYNDTDPNLYNENFYVITDQNAVYKCIDNGYSVLTPNGVPSTYEPSSTTTIGNFTTPDGYIWKYMFTVDPTTYNNFQSANYIPVTPNNAVQGNAVPGTIDSLVLTNGGTNYQIYEEGFLQSVVNNYVVQLPSTSSPSDNYYSGSSIYFKAGFGAGQLANIVNYSGTTKLITVNPPFNYYENLQLSNVNGIFNIGNLIYQNIAYITYYYQSGYLNTGDTLIQSDTGVYGTINFSNSTNIVLNEQFKGLSPNYPMYDTSYSAVKRNGKVSISNNSSNVVAVSNNYFSNDFSVGSYIRIGENANTNLRRVVSVNSSIITVNYPFNNILTSANCYYVNNAISINGFSEQTYEGAVVYTNLNSTELSISNTQPSNSSFFLGETVVIVDSSNTSQGANGTVSFANSSNMILNNVNGNVNNLANLYAYGLYSQAKAYINNNISYPNITVSTIEGGFLSGVPVVSAYANGVPSGNALVVSSYTSPNELTEYVISPKVNIEGDGNGALAYCTVDLSGNNPSRSISSIILINGGESYTQANISISSNTLYGSGAIVQPQISPVNGHGYDAYTELGAIYAGLYTKFDTAVNENYSLPLYGSYRTIGIIKNPAIKDAIINLTDFDRIQLGISNTSGTFSIGEIVYQPSSNAAGVISTSNSSSIVLDNYGGTFNFDSSNLANSSTLLYGLISGANSHCTSSNVVYFILPANTEALVDSTSGGTATMTQVISNTQIRVSNVVGKFSQNDLITESLNGNYANIDSIYTSNGTVNSTVNFGSSFNQTARLTLSSNTNNYNLYEYVTQNTTYATGRIISKTDELDLVYNAAASFSVGDILINANTGSNAVVTYANNSSNYLKLSAVNMTGFNETTHKPFNVGDTIKNPSGSKISTINNVYSVLVLDDVRSIVSSNTTPFIGEFGVYQISGYEIVGNTSGSVGIMSLVKLPDLVRESGQVIYLENMTPFNVNATSTEQVNIVIKF